MARIAGHRSTCALRRLVAVSLFSLLGGLAVGRTSIAQDDQQAGSDYAILIGVENYQHVPKLRFTNNDVRLLGEAIEQRSRTTYESVLKVFDDDASGWYPNRETLIRAIPYRLKMAKPDDRVTVYFSGHGFRDDAGKLYLATIDTQLDNLAETALSVDWLRDELEQCQAQVKLLILDACHAGAESDDATVVPAQALGNEFKSARNVITIASSTGDQKSQLWPEKEQSLFSYWMQQALKGHADTNGDAAIDIDELYAYVHENVTKTARSRLGREQTPVRIVRSGVEGVPVVLRLKPATLKQVIEDVAQQIAWTAEEQKMSRLAVLEFTEDTALGEVLRTNYGLLGQYCAKELQDRLLKLSRGNFSVADQRRLERALSEEAFAIENLGEEERLQKLSEKLGGLPGLTLGTFQNRIGRDLGLRCQFVKTQGGDLMCSAGGTAKLSESEWAMLGRSGWVNPDQVAPPDGGYDPEGKQTVKIDVLDKQTRHPLNDPRFPFNVRILVNGRERPGKFERNKDTGREEYVVRFSPGEVYSVWVANNSGKTACMRLMVDGLNTLPQKHLDKGVETVEVAPRVNLEDARHWVLDPKVSRVNAIAGFVTETGVRGRLREFKVVDAEASVAARKNFTEQIGLITAAFYKTYEFREDSLLAGSAPGGTFGSALGTDFGEERVQNLEVREEKPAELIGVVHIRYLRAE